MALFPCNIGSGGATSLDYVAFTHVGTYINSTGIILEATGLEVGKEYLLIMQSLIGDSTDYFTNITFQNASATYISDANIRGTWHEYIYKVIPTSSSVSASGTYAYNRSRTGAIRSYFVG